jgi:hypothetical protein
MKRRKDFERYEFRKHQRPWRRMYQVGNRIYKVNLLTYPGFWQEWNWVAKHLGIWGKLRSIYLTLRYNTVMYYGPARTTAELNREAAEFNARWKNMIKSGAIEACFKS